MLACGALQETAIEAAAIGNRGGEGMDDLAYGVRNKRGDWAPKDPLTIAPIYRLPWNAREIAIWFKDYLFPWAVTWMAIAALYWYVLIPRVETMRTLAPGWIAYLFLLNCAGVLLFFGA